MVPTTEDDGHVQAVSDLHNLFPKYNHIIPCHQKERLDTFYDICTLCSLQCTPQSEEKKRDERLVDD
jgi:hypothetical protein